MLRQLVVGAVVSALSSEGVVLTFESEEHVGGVVLRTVLAPCDLHDDCEVPVTVLAREGLDFWVAVAAREAARVELDELLELEVGREAAALLAVAFGVPWRDVSVSLLLGQFALVASVEDETAKLLGSLDVEGLVRLRAANPQPADVLRCLRLMREHGAVVQ